MLINLRSIKYLYISLNIFTAVSLSTKDSKKKSERQSTWMSEVMSEFGGLRTPEIDFMMTCTTLSVNN